MSIKIYGTCYSSELTNNGIYWPDMDPEDGEGLFGNGKEGLWTADEFGDDASVFQYIWGDSCTEEVLDKSASFRVWAVRDHIVNSSIPEPNSLLLSFACISVIGFCIIGKKNEL
ncbi:hypothetical protein KY328_05435, partial [Candidatus Woesearchaeota archaeon]|nr:hypothetical protein [Candidatus Woesearchaeota archaeon]